MILMSSSDMTAFPGDVTRTRTRTLNADMTAFLGDVSAWTGVVTIFLMLASPALFERLGWSGVAKATPQILLVGGLVFWGGSIAYQYIFGAAAPTLLSAQLLQVSQECRRWRPCSVECDVLILCANDVRCDRLMVHQCRHGHK